MAQKVLVIDDEQHMRMFITTLLETSGFKPLSAENGVKGLAIAREQKPALIIMDVMMGKESGIDVYRELKDDPDLKKIPVIVVSAMAKKSFFHFQSLLDKHTGDSIPEPVAYIEKPPESDELLEAIKDVLRQAG
jgi:CheY-like chemotaxis protein